MFVRCFVSAVQDVAERMSFFLYSYACTFCSPGFFFINPMLFPILKVGCSADGKEVQEHILQNMKDMKEDFVEDCSVDFLWHCEKCCVFGTNCRCPTSKISNSSRAVENRGDQPDASTAFVSDVHDFQQARIAEEFDGFRKDSTSDDQPMHTWGGFNSSKNFLKSLKSNVVALFLR